MECKKNHMILLNFLTFGVQAFEVRPSDSLEFLSVSCYVPLSFLILLIWVESCSVSMSL